MTRHARWIAVCAVLWLSACCTIPHPRVDTEARRAAAVDTRWIGMTRPLHRSCPVPATANWTVRPLVPLDKLSRELQASVRKAGLDRFCVYDYHGQKPHPKLPQEVVRRLRPGAEPDRVAMATSADSLGDIAWHPFYQRFLDQVRMPVPASPSLKASNQSSVRLAFLDSQPTGVGVAKPPEPGKPDHGYALTNIAGQLVGSAQGKNSSSVQIVSRLILPVVRFDPSTGAELERDEIHGGFRGTYTDLAQAILDEIAGWQPSPAGGPQHLVLNLSVGWDSEKFGGSEPNLTDMPVEVQAVYSALQTAADQGVLVLAAAGNELSGPSPTGKPLLPGGWESRGPKPVVYAVSGVDGRDHPLVNTRSQGEAPRVAYADHVTVPDIHNIKQHTPTMTGTSIATAVVSTTAALVWSYHPELPPAGVMQLLSNSAVKLNRMPDFSAVPSPGPVRRISLCNALCWARETNGELCQTQCDKAHIVQTPPLDENLSMFLPDSTMDGALLSTVVDGWNQFPNLLDQPWVGPQPGVDPCPNCAVTGPPDRATMLVLPPVTAGVALAAFRSGGSLKLQSPAPDYNLRIEIPDAWAAGDLQGATLEVFDFDSRGRKQLQTGCSLGKSFVHGSTLEVTNPCLGKITADSQARLSFVLAPPPGSPKGTTSLAVDSPLFVEYTPPAVLDLDQYSPLVQNGRHAPPDRREGQGPGE